jgi:hypothetical protein
MFAIRFTLGLLALLTVEVSAWMLLTGWNPIAECREAMAVFLP